MFLKRRLGQKIRTPLPSSQAKHSKNFAAQEAYCLPPKTKHNKPNMPVEMYESSDSL